MPTITTVSNRTSSDKVTSETVSHIEDTQQKTTKPFIGNIEQAEEFQRTNKYIQRGYRVNFNSFWDATRTLFMIHNETVNVWSHLIGAFLFICFGLFVFLYMAPSSMQDRSTLERWSSGFDIGKLDSKSCLAETSWMQKIWNNDF